jgi:hypothetical protein
MVDLETAVVLVLGFIVTIGLWRRSWNSRLRDIEPFILVFGALPATFLWLFGMSIVFGSLGKDPPAAPTIDTTTSSASTNAR